VSQELALMKFALLVQKETCFAMEILAQLILSVLPILV
jgi:hypothetical protein